MFSEWKTCVRAWLHCKWGKCSFCIRRRNSCMCYYYYWNQPLLVCLKRIKPCWHLYICTSEIAVDGEKQVERTYLISSSFRPQTNGLSKSHDVIILGVDMRVITPRRRAIDTSINCSPTRVTYIHGFVWPSAELEQSANNIHTKI